MDIDNIVAVTALIISVIAILQSSDQLKESNKQFLFDRRLNGLTIVNMLIDSFKKGPNFSAEKESEEENPFNKFLISYMFYTNNPFLANIQPTITLDLYKDITYEEQKKYLYKFNEMKELSYEMKFIFKFKDLEYISEFVSKFQEFLFLIIRASISVKNINKNAKCGLNGKTFHEAFMEDNDAIKLEAELDKICLELLDLVNKIEDNKIIEKIEKEMLILS